MYGIVHAHIYKKDDNFRQRQLNNYYDIGVRMGGRIIVAIINHSFKRRKTTNE